MGILSRLSFAIRSQLSKLIEGASDPSAELDYSYEQMRDELQDVKKGIADLTTQKKRLQKHRDRLQGNVEKHNEQAREAVRQGRDDLARRALEKKQANLSQIEELGDQIEDLEATQSRLVNKKDELEQRVEQFRTKKETMKAQYEAAEAGARVSEALTGVGDEMGEVGRSIERMRDRTDEMESRAAALEELEETGALDSVLDEGDSIDRELERISADREVDTELETLKAEMGDGQADPSGDTEAASSPVEVDQAAVDEELAELEAETEEEEPESKS
jgi:phage shock protein A